MLLWCAPAWADTLELLGPLSAVAAEGFPVAVVRRDASGTPVPVGAASVVAEGADLRDGPEQPPLRTFVVVPRPGVRDVVVRASVDGLEARARYPLGPPATEVRLALEPPAPVKGRDKEARLTVRLVRPDGTDDDSGAPPVVRVSTGRVEGLERTGPGTYSARYVLPDTRFPEVAILVAFSAWPHPQSTQGAYGRVLVPLAASVTLPGTTEPDAQISIGIAGQSFGPVAAGPDGRFRLPIIVPPGHRMGEGRVVDRAGNVRRIPIDLMLPPTDGLACVLQPQRLPADGASRARLVCATSDPLGRPVEDARVTAQARHGTLTGPTRAPGGLLEWRYTAPRALAPDERIDAAWPQRGTGSREELALQLVQGPVAEVGFTLADALVHHGSSTRAQVTTQDAFGRPRPGAAVELRAPVGDFSPPVESPPGTFTTTWTPPPSGDAAEVTVSARAWGPAGSEPARLSVWREGGALYAGVSDLAGLPVPSQPLRVNGQPVETGADGTVRLGPPRPGTLEVTHAVWPGLTRTVHVLGVDGPVYPLEASLVPDAVSQRVRLAPEVPVNVRLRVEGTRVTYWVEDARGQVLEGREVHVALSGGERVDEEVRDGRTSFTVRAAGPVGVSVADVRTGVTAVAEVRP
ncbi:hypothetical protein HPC49_07605 [Pyxidicoccus fallax]|uniref:Uncharacterized protein n=1 Tax=Pyxidicoccus fallax TaxID=394095 RepID=A0A848L5W0_9BACT|nr:hypothetical protein [Pyxidicoccus fallax]NMO14074.1 hypothetical protein [Pyxidicoccus fallax]NPC78118.1 hypothetical protein [Pyxidicoccus fallax]